MQMARALLCMRSAYILSSFFVVFTHHCSQVRSRYSCKNICGNTDKLLEYMVSVEVFYKGVTTLNVLMPKISVLKLSTKA